MTSNTGRGFFSYRIPARILTSAVFIACLSLTALPQAHAQEDDAPAWSLKRLFTSRKIEPAAPEPEAVAPAAAAPAAAKKKPRVSREPIETPSSVVAKRPDAKSVLVIGDFLGSGLAEGLSTAFVENPHVRVVDRTNGSSGFVRDDFYDWPARIGELIDAEKPAAIVIMLGANDRQQMLVDGSREPVRSETWVKTYTERTQALTKAIADRKVPFIWVGVPSFKSSKMLLDMLAFNEIFKGAATAAGGEFVDIWDGFVDEDGAYVANGPDLNGQPARLRAADGINLARPGKRKLAFYAEKPLGKLLGDAVNAPAVIEDALAGAPSEASFIGPVLAPPAEEAEVVIGPSDLGPVEPGVAVSLRSPALDGGTELLGLVVEPRHDATTPGEKLVIEGIASAAMPGRADDFSWSAAGATAFASAIAPAEPTTGKGVVPAILASLVLPSPPIAPAPMIARAVFLATPTPVAPATTLPAPEEVSLPAARMPVTELAPADPPEQDRTVAFKGRVFVAPPGSTGDKSPSRASPAALLAMPLTSGPVAEGAPTALPPAVIDLPPVEIERPVAAQMAPTIIASSSVTDEPTGARLPAPRVLRTARGDVAPRPTITPDAVPVATTSGPPASAVALAPAAPAEDLAPARQQIGRVASTATVRTMGRRNAPTDPAALASGDASPGRAAPATASAPLPGLLPDNSKKAPPALVDRLDDAAPAPAAPAMLIATLPAIDDNFSSVPAIAAPESGARDALPAPTTLPESGAQVLSLQERPALAVPPATDFGQPAEIAPSAPPAGPAALAEPAFDAAPGREVGDVIAAPWPQAPVQAAPSAPVSAPSAEPALPTTEAAKPVANEEPDAPVAVPATDIALPQPVPPDLVPAVQPTQESVPASGPPAEKTTQPAVAMPELLDPAVSAPLSAATGNAGAPEPDTAEHAIAALGTAEPEAASSPQTVDDAEPLLPPSAMTDDDKQPAAGADAETPIEGSLAAVQPVAVEELKPVAEAAPVAPVEIAGSDAKSEHPVPETDIALLDAVPPDLIPAAPAPETEATEQAIATLQTEAPQTEQPKPLETAPRQDVAPATQPEPAEIVQPDAQVASDTAVAMPEIDVALLAAVPPDLMPAAPVRVEKALEPDAPVEGVAAPELPATPAPAGAAANTSSEPVKPVDRSPTASEAKPETETADQSIAALQSEVPDLPALLHTAPDQTAAPAPGSEPVEVTPIVGSEKAAPVSVPETDVALLEAVPPDLMPAVTAVTEKVTEPAVPAEDAAQPESPDFLAPETIATTADVSPAPAGAATAAGASQPPAETTAPGQAVASLQPLTAEAAEPQTLAAVPSRAVPAAIATERERPIIVPEIDVSLLRAVPPDLKPEMAQTAVQQQPDKPGEQVAPAIAIPGLLPFDSVDDIPLPLMPAPL